VLLRRYRQVNKSSIYFVTSPKIMSAACTCVLTFFRVVISLVIGIPLGIIPGTITAIGVVLITVIRYPVNFYKTFRVTIVTALLKKRLKFLVLLSLAIFQLLYPPIAVIVAVVVGIIFSCGQSVARIYNGTLPWSYSDLDDIFRGYYKFHVTFYDDTLEAYNHPTGVPLNWNGVRYDIPNFGLVKTLLGVLLTIYGVVTVSVGTIFILGLKYIFLHIRMLYLYTKTLPESFNCKNLPFLPFWLCTLALLIPLGPILLLLAVLVSPLLGLLCPYVAITHGMNLKHGVKTALEILIKLDRNTYEFGGNFRLLKDRDLGLEYTPPQKPTNDTSKYWDLFIDNCKLVVKDTKDKGWILQEDIEGAMPNVLSSIPAMTILKILLRSAEQKGNTDVLVWDEDHICDPEDAVNHDDDLVEFFWPKLKSILEKLKKTSKEEQMYLMTQLCANSETNTENLNTALKVFRIEEEKKIKIHQISSEINGMVIVLLRMEQMQKRMSEFLT